jgi:hypothetical protein
MRILPVTIEGTRFALPAGGLHVTRGAVAHVSIGRPVDPADHPEVTHLIAAVRGAIEEKLPRELRG